MSNRFEKQTINGADVIVDNVTGLMWDAADSSPERLPHEEAMQAAAKVRTAGFEDWRAPTQIELETLRDLARFDPAADPILNLRSSWYWSSTPAAESPSGFAWAVSFDYGYSGILIRNYTAFVRAVRSARASQ